MKKNYALFDIGNVICHVHFNKALDLLSYKLNITTAEASYFLKRVQHLHDLGLTNLEDELRDHFKIKSDRIIQEILVAWNDCISPEPEMINFLEDLSKDTNIAIVSNIGLEHAENIHNLMHKAEISNTFWDSAIHFFSCDVGARKPSLLYFQTFLSLYPEFKGCVYVDDLHANLQTGTKFGFQSYHMDLSSKEYYDNQTRQFDVNKLRNNLFNLSKLIRV